MNLGYFLTVRRRQSPHVFPCLCFIGLHKAAARRSSTLRISCGSAVLQSVPVSRFDFLSRESGVAGNNYSEEAK